MRKYIITFIVCLLLSPMLFAITLLDTREILVNTQVTVFGAISLNPISQSANEGMPFDITAEDVAWDSDSYNAKTGRHIANWSLEANMAQASLEINATPLTNTADYSQGLGYHLFFYYTYYENGNTTLGPSTGVFEVHSGNESNTITLQDGPYYFFNKSIFFLFDEDAAPVNVSDGSYIATLTIILTEGT